MFRKRTDTGFTLIELMLAMVFVAFILVFVSLTTVQMFRTYDKGAAMKEVNQAGQSIVEDISTSIRAQAPSNVDVTKVSAGALCIGNVMYVWKPLYIGNSLNNNPNPYDAVLGNAASGASMAREILSNPAAGCDATKPTTQQTALLSSKSRVLRSTATRSGDDNRLVKLSFVIGTFSRSEFTPVAQTHYMTPMLSGGNFSCLPGSDGNYCAFAQFDTVLYIAKEQ